MTGTITVSALAAGRGNNSIEVVFKNCAVFTDCISKINNKKIENAKDIDVVMPMYNFIEYMNNFSKSITKFMAILYRWTSFDWC